MNGLSISNKIAESLPVSIIQTQMSKLSIFQTKEWEKLVSIQCYGD